MGSATLESDKSGDNLEPWEQPCKEIPPRVRTAIGVEDEGIYIQKVLMLII